MHMVTVARNAISSRLSAAVVIAGIAMAAGGAMSLALPRSSPLLYIAVVPYFVGVKVAQLRGTWVDASINLVIGISAVVDTLVVWLALTLRARWRTAKHGRRER